MKKKTIVILIAVVLIAIVFSYGVTPYLSYQSFTSAINSNDTSALKDLTQGAVLKFNLRSRIRNRLYDELLADQGRKLRDFENAAIETQSAVLAEKLVDKHVSEGGLVYIMLDPLLQDKNLHDSIPLLEAYSILNEQLKNASMRRKGTSKFIIDYPVQLNEEEIRNVEIWFDRYGMVWRITDIKESNSKE